MCFSICLLFFWSSFHSNMSCRTHYFLQELNEYCGYVIHLIADVMMRFPSILTIRMSELQWLTVSGNCNLQSHNFFTYVTHPVNQVEFHHLWAWLGYGKNFLCNNSIHCTRNKYAGNEIKLQMDQPWKTFSSFSAALRIDLAISLALVVFSGVIWRLRINQIIFCDAKCALA